MNGNAIKVVLWGNTVGYLTWDSSDWRTETAVFRFSEDFLDRGLDISPLRMPLNSILVQSHQNIRGTSPKSRFGGLPPVFADSLPDHWGNSIFRKWAESHKISMAKVTSVDLLSFIGKRAMGALEYEPAFIVDEDKEFGVNVNELYRFAESVLSDRNELEFDANHELLWADLVKLGTSPGGKRPKALIAINDSDGSIKSGQALLPEGYSYYILKYDNESELFPYARLEYAYYRMCCDAEIDDEGNVTGEPTEAALVAWANTLGLNKTALKASLPRCGEAPFDSGRKMMSTLHLAPNGVVQYTKGAPDVIIGKCTHYLKNGEAEIGRASCRERV